MAGLSYQLHKLTARLDRAADQILLKELDITYARFLALYAVTQGAETQRQLAVWLGVSEPSVSRMAAVLSREGLLDVAFAPSGGNRRCLTLTPAGKRVVSRGGRMLEDRFAKLVADSGVPHSRYESYTQRLIAKLEAEAVGPLGATVGR